MTATATRLTYADYAKLPNDGKRYEVIDGELFVNPAPVPRHQLISGNLYVALHAHLRSHRSGIVLYSPIDVLFADDRIVQPDLVVIGNDRLHMIGPKNIQGPPHILIEILSPGSRRYDQIRKRKLYESAGVDEYWIVDPEGQGVKIYRLQDEKYVLAASPSVKNGEAITSPLLDGFSMPIAGVFA